MKGTILDQIKNHHDFALVESKVRRSIVSAITNQAQESFERITNRKVREQAKKNDDCIRSLLGRWVSELEPTVCFNCFGDVVGLAWAEDPQAAIVVAAEKFCAAWLERRE